MNDDAKRLILARRARFVAAAVAGISIGGCDTCSPRSSQGERTPPADSTPTGPTVCLSPTVPRRDSSAELAELDELAKVLADAIEAGAGSDGAGLAAHDAGAVVDAGVRGWVTEHTTSADAIPNAELIVRAQLVPRTRACYTAALKDDASLKGTVAMRVKVTAKGEVAEVTPSKIVGLTPAVVTCATRAAKNLQFGQSATGGTFEVTLDFARES